MPGTLLESRGVVDATRVLRQAAHVEKIAAEIYRTLSRRFAADSTLRGFWASMADDERKHAKKLATWRRLLELTPPERHPSCDEVAPIVRALENLARELRARASRAADVDEAFSIALALESSELDVIYTRLLQSSPIARFPDLEETRKSEIGRHHQALLEMVRARSKDEGNRVQAALLAAEEP
jgi:rubrerythrin